MILVCKEFYKEVDKMMVWWLICTVQKISKTFKMKNVTAACFVYGILNVSNMFAMSKDVMKIANT